MLHESRTEFMLRWHLYRRWHKPPNPTRKAEYTFYKMMDSLSEGVFLDLGANVGQVTRKALSYGHDVIAFEPDPRALTVLRENFANDRRVTIIPKAVGANSRTATFCLSDKTTEASSLVSNRDNETGATIEVEVIDIVGFLRGIDRPIAAIKMDIEGAEAECLEAILDAGLHRRVGYILVELHAWISPDIDKRLAAIRARIAAENILNIDLSWG
jgi:FkbM family methyltransferase